jgi:hypothetical protein
VQWPCSADDRFSYSRGPGAAADGDAIASSDDVAIMPAVRCEALAQTQNVRTRSARAARVAVAIRHRIRVPPSIFVDRLFEPFPRELFLHYGDRGIGGTPGFAPTYGVANAPVAGTIGIFQLVNYYIAPGGFQPITTSGHYQYDDEHAEVPWYGREATVPAGGSATLPPVSDSPGFPLDHLQTIELEENFKDYFMFRPHGGIWVPLGYLQWGWHVLALGGSDTDTGWGPCAGGST